MITWEQYNTRIVWRKNSTVQEQYGARTVRCENSTAQGQYETPWHHCIQYDAYNIWKVQRLVYIVPRVNEPAPSLLHCNNCWWLKQCNLWIFGGLNLTPVYPNPMFHCKRDMSNCLQISKDVLQLKLSLIGLKSGEYGGKKRRTQPKPSITSRSAHVLWIAQLSRINMLLSWE